MKQMISSLKFPLFGGIIEINFHDLDPIFLDSISEGIKDEAYRLQKIFNLFDEKSEINKLNKKRKLKVSKELHEVLRTALNYCELTKGKYDVSKGKEFLYRKKGKNITVDCNYKDIRLTDDTIELMNEEIIIDLSSIAKGYITDKIAEFIKNSGIDSFSIDSRGDLLIADDELLVEVQNPRNDSSIFTLSLKNRAIATSGDYKQYFGTFANSHIIGNDEFISSTVIADDLMTADVIATVLLLFDVRQLENFLTNNPYPAIMVTKNKRVLTFNDLGRFKN